MQEFTGKVAVITGAGSGIGKGLAEKAAAEGMRLVLSDVNSSALEGLAAELTGKGAELATLVVDVSVFDEVEKLAQFAYAQFGQVDLLFNNAGVLISGFSWERSIEDWQWIMGVNFWGVLHGIKAFVPRMLAQQTEGHIVNTSSLAGLLASPLMAPYTVGKQAVVALAETLHYELESIDSKLATSVLCPGPIATGIAASGESREAGTDLPDDAPEKALMGFLTAGIAAGMTPQDCADKVFAGVRGGDFWIFTHEDFKDSYRARVDTVVNNTNPHYEVYVTQE